MNIGLAFKTFARVVSDKVFAAKVNELLSAPALPAPKVDAKPRRTDAVELLAALQREGRLVDFLQEKLEGYSDAQIGAAVRDIHRDCGKTLDRMFGIDSLVAQPEGSSVNIPAEIDPGQWKLTGQVGPSATKGNLCHHGWKITRHEIPAWTGRDASAWVIAPAEVEIP